jgi:hypothetical protein
MERWLKELWGSVRSIPRDIVLAIGAAIVAPLLVNLLADTKAPLWATVAAGLVGLLVGLVLGRLRAGATADAGLRAKVGELEARAGELGAYDTYAVHLRDVLDSLRQVSANELSSFSTRDFIEVGIFGPANELLARDHHTARGVVRFAILRPQGAYFVMADTSDLLPALGYGLATRQNFRLEIRGSFAGIAMDHGEVMWSNDLAMERLFKPHPMANPERAYCSIVCVPLWRAGRVDAVLNVVAERKDAFTAVDRTYIALLGSVIDVAESLPPALAIPLSPPAPSVPSADSSQ